MLSNKPPALLEKYNPDGSAQPYAGNTIICHIDKGSTVFAALSDAHEMLKSQSFSSKLSFLPTASYHMTVFGGANDKHRLPGSWPSYLPLDASMAECNMALQSRLLQAGLSCDLPIRMRVAPDEVRDSEMTLRLELMPLDAAEDDKLRNLRDRLSNTMGIRVAGHETYRFHISLAYLIDWLTPAESLDYKACYARLRDTIAAASPVIELGAPEFCTFADMLHFSPQFHLDGGLRGTLPLVARDATVEKPQAK